MSQIAHRYAQALYNLAKEQGQIPAVAKDLGLLYEVLKADASLNAFLENQFAIQEDIVKALAIISSKLNFSKLTQDFLQLLTLNRRVNFLQSIISRFQAIYQRDEGVLKGEIFTASPLPRKLKAEFEKTLSQKMGRQIQLSEVQDNELIGGMVIKVGSYMIDASLKTQLHKLRDVLKG